MSVQTFLLAVLVVVYGAAQYILAAQAIRDLVRRPSVRGGNKTVWGIVILTIPIGGALLYTWMGPTSFLRRHGDTPATILSRPVAGRRTTTAAQPKITPIATLRDDDGSRPFTTQRSPVAAPVPGSRRRPPDRLRRTGS